VKTTLEIPEPLFRKAKATAAERGQSLKQYFTDALEEKLRKEHHSTKSKEPEWMKLFGAFGKTAAMRAENRKIEKIIEDAFERIEPEDHQ
jgi:hypothetical protein